MRRPEGGAQEKIVLGAGIRAAGKEIPRAPPGSVVSSSPTCESVNRREPNFPLPWKVNGCETLLSARVGLRRMPKNKL